MSRLLCFSNPGELDLRLVTTFGANVKPASASPIGYFGTGLKYAIAVALREGCSIEVQVGTTVRQFATRLETIRDKEFKMVYLGDQPCGFTLDLGKNWKPWMAFRELWANAMDEGGFVDLIHEAPPPTAGETRVIVRGEAMLEAFAQRHEFILDGAPRWKGEELSVHAGRSKGVFYKGFLVFTPKSPAMFGYNILIDMRLTEDRVATNIYEVWKCIAGPLASECKDVGLLAEIVNARQGSFEHELDYSWAFHGLSTEFMAAARPAIKAAPTLVNRTMLEKVRSIDSTVASPEPALLTPVEEKTLLRALAFAKKHGFAIEQEVVVTDSLGESVLGTVLGETIYLSRRVFMQGTKMVAGTLVEEFVHARHGFGDCTREMQNFLLDRLMSAYEDLDGEPL